MFLAVACKVLFAVFVVLMAFACSGFGSLVCGVFGCILQLFISVCTVWYVCLRCLWQCFAQFYLMLVVFGDSV